ncbi:MULTISPECIES: DUF6191 domain-containing protein [unclassified Streptomyces]|uniref:DUF6191 domain-containing protein n=1 Tax=unclassified Streptomyces TaxID=2593676 RepID=UPI002D2198CE|nr:MULTISPECIES: DUF6191 domain-containing protein [unclassified Streptomyces]
MAELFAPGRRHTEEERQRLALTREDQGDADPGRGPVDLRSGRVTIRVPRPEEPSGGGSAGRGDQVQAVGEGGGLAPAGDPELGEDVGDVDAGRLG